MAKKQKTNLFSGGLLATTAEEQQEQNIHQGNTQQATEQEEDDPLFGNTKRILDITQRAISVNDASGYPKIAIALLENNPYQPRRRMNEKRLEFLTNEIHSYGFKGVLLARQHPDDQKRYQLVYGHRRREASKRAGLTELPVMIDNSISDDEMKFLAVNENILRDDLTPLDEAYAYAAMLEEMSQDAVANRLGVSRGYIRNRTDILKAPEDVQDMVEEKPNTMKAVFYLKDIEEDDIRKATIQALLNEDITINQVKAFINNTRKATAASVMPTSVIETVSDLPQPTQNHTIQDHNTAQAQPDYQVTEIVTLERGAPKPPEQQGATIVQRSKEQTEATTDQTKLETFIKYLRKYNQRLEVRSMTTEERVALDNLITVTKNILEQH